jgi:hypothetical protein
MTVGRSTTPGQASCSGVVDQCCFSFVMYFMFFFFFSICYIFLFFSFVIGGKKIVGLVFFCGGVLF